MGLFFKKQKNPEEVVPAQQDSSAAWQELVARWDAFILKIQQREKEILLEAVEHSQQLIQETEFDTTALQQVWTGIETNTVQALYNKAYSGWEKLQEEMDNAEELQYTSEDLQKEGRKLDELQTWLEIEYTRHYSSVIAQAAKKIHQNAAEDLAVKNFCCSRCSASIQLGNNIFHALNKKCLYCGFVNTYEPSHRVRSVEAFAVHALCQEAAFPVWEQMKWTERRIHASGKDAPLELLLEWEKSTLQYWQVFFEKQVEIIPAYEEQKQRNIEGKMEWFKRELNTYPQWKKSVHKS